MRELVRLTALFLGFLGAWCAYCDSWRTASRFSPDGVALGYEPELMTWWWTHCGRIGFILLALAFGIEAGAIAVDLVIKCRNRKKHNHAHAGQA